MNKAPATDYQTYREIMGELMQPIHSEGLDLDTLKRLYDSKLVYLESLRTKCFREMNTVKDSPFKSEDLALILQAIGQTKEHIGGVVRHAVVTSLARRKVV
jgi:hypothetical protein